MLLGSSHVLAEIERVADYLLLITGGLVRLDGAVDELCAAHRLMTGTAGCRPSAGWQVIWSSQGGAQEHLLVRLTAPAHPAGNSRGVGVEEVAMACLREPPASPSTAPVEAQR